MSFRIKDKLDDFIKKNLYTTIRHNKNFDREILKKETFFY